MDLRTLHQCGGRQGERPRVHHQRRDQPRHSLQAGSHRRTLHFRTVDQQFRDHRHAAARLPDAGINEQYVKIADFPYRGALIRDRFKSIDDMLAMCRMFGENKPRECILRDRGNEFEWLNVTTSTDTPRDETFFLLSVATGRNARCLQEPECVERYSKARQ